MENNVIIYIVYCTVNIVNGFYYVGVHKTTVGTLYTDGYIGCGVYCDDYSTYKYPKTKFQQAVKEFGPSKFKRIVLKTFDNEDDAYLLEEYIVDEKFLARSDVYNMILGGKWGIRNPSIPVYKYSIDGDFIEEFRCMRDAAVSVNRNLRSIQRALSNKHKCADYFWSVKKYDKLDLTYYHTQEISRGFPVFQYSETGEYDCCYESIRDCARVNNISDSNLGIAIKLGTKCNGKYYLTTFAESYSIANFERIQTTKVYQYALDGTFIKEWESANKARKSLGFTSDIYKAIKLGRTAGNFQWSLERLPYMEPIKPTSGRKRKIGKYDPSGKLVKMYDTLNACKKENGSGLAHVLDGRDKTHKGFTYKYID